MAKASVDQRTYIFFDSLKNGVSQAGTSESIFNNNYSVLNLEISGTTAISGYMEGCVNTVDGDGNPLTDAQCAWSKLNTINATTFEAGTTITNNGIYTISLTGIRRYRFVISSITGSGKITGVAQN